MNWLPLVLAIVPTLASAQEQEDKTRAMDELIACRGLSENAQRLACFDHAAETLAGARASGELMVLDRKAVVVRKQQRFGLTTSTSEMFGGGAADQATEVRQLDSKVAAVTSAKAYGRFDIQLTNGSVWQTAEAMAFPPRVGAAITLKEAPLGGYRATIAGGRSILVKRIR